MTIDAADGINASPDDTAARQPVRLVLASHVQLYAQSLGQVLRVRHEIELLGIATTRIELLNLIENHSPDIALVDLAMNDGIETARTLVRSVPGLRVVGFSIAPTEPDIIAAAEAGLAGYVLRDATLDDLLAVLWGAMRDMLVCSPRLAAILNARLAALASRNDAAPNTSLTPRELEVAELVDQGLSNKQIARALGLRLSTVKNHVHSILEKLSIDRRGQVATRLPDRAIPVQSACTELDATRDLALVLTPRERQIAAMIDEALPNDEIAHRLNIRISTVKNHVHSILEKLHVERRGQAAAVLRLQSQRPSVC